MHPRKIQIRALRGSDSERWDLWRGANLLWGFNVQWRWIWICHQHHVSYPCTDWETAMSWVDHHIKQAHREM